MDIIRAGDYQLLILSWKDIIKLVDKLTEKIISSYKPNTIVGVLRGGMIIANLISDNIDLKEIYAIGCKSYYDINKRNIVKIYHPLILEKLSDRKVLLVDDVSDTGNTLETAINYILKPKEPEELKSATIYIKPWCKIRPDYYLKETRAWIVYPWERYETMRLIKSKINNKKTLKKIHKIFKEKLGINKAFL
ncbi:MAG: phosphoribosyltransferase [Nitrososphaerota archaeon]